MADAGVYMIVSEDRSVSASHEVEVEHLMATVVYSTKYLITRTMSWPGYRTW